jgi:hypothetical protein
MAQRDSFIVTLLTVFPDNVVAGEDILCLLWNPNVYFRVHDSKPLVSTLSQMKQHVAYPHHTFIYINIISNVFPGLQNGKYFTMISSDQNVVISSMRATCWYQLIHLHLITLGVSLFHNLA